MGGAGRRARRIGALLALGAVIATASSAAGCGDDGDATASRAVEAPSADVAAVDFAFEPAEIRIEAGEAVTWANTGEELHNVKGPGFFSAALASGETYEHRFRRPGRYRYLCTLHPTTMRGLISVARPAS
jgi:plastocyanin